MDITSNTGRGWFTGTYIIDMVCLIRFLLCKFFNRNLIIMYIDKKKLFQNQNITKT